MKKVKVLGLVVLSSLMLSACSNDSSNNSGESSSKETNESTTVTSETQKQTSEKEDKPKDSGDFVEKASDASFDGKMLKGNSYSIKITDHKVIQPGDKGNEYGEKTIIAFWFDTLVSPNYDNSTPINPNTAWILNFEAVQDNSSDMVNKLEVAPLPDEAHLQSQSAEIKPGGTVASSIAYTLTDNETPVKLTAKSMLGNDFGSAEFPVK